MSALAHAVQLVKKWEGCRLTAYPAPATGGAPWTIGYGATGPGIAQGMKWSQKQADGRLAIDLDRFTKGVQSVLRRPATGYQLGAMVSLAYNTAAGSIPLGLLALFTATSSTNIDLSAVLPVTATRAIIQVLNPSSRTLYVSRSEVGTASAANYQYVAIAGSCLVLDVTLSAGRSFNCVLSSTDILGGIIAILTRSVTISLIGYEFDR